MKNKEKVFFKANDLVEVTEGFYEGQFMVLVTFDLHSGHLAGIAVNITEDRYIVPNQQLGGMLHYMHPDTIKLLHRNVEIVDMEAVEDEEEFEIVYEFIPEDSEEKEEEEESEDIEYLPLENPPPLRVLNKEKGSE